jgi:hypothetical protein
MAQYNRQDGVLTQEAIAPSIATLRPLLSNAKGFPVFGQLETELLKPAKPFDKKSAHPDWVVGQTLATCAGYAYSDAETVATMMARLGLEGNRCKLVGEYVDAMFIESTAFVVQSEDGRVVVLAFRGTQPANLINWLTNLDVHPDKVRITFNDQPGDYGVHAGFYRNTRATRFAITDVLKQALAGESICPTQEEKPGVQIEKMQALYITGHSLGAAMGAIYTLLMRTQPDYWNTFESVFRGAYFFGQPLIGNPQLADEANKIAELGDVIRFIYQADPVPHLPPQETGRFKNFGREFRWNGRKWSENKTGKQVGQMFRAAELYGAAAGGLIRQIPALGWVKLPYEIDDHDPQHYIRALTEKGNMTEFGDYDYLT